MPGKLIVIDGADGCGKATQTKILLKRLNSERSVAETLDFPQYYNNQFGNIVGCFLRGDFGDPAAANPYIASILYAADRFESSAKIKNWLAEEKIVILDRYVSANQIHQGSKIKNEKERETFLSWLEKIEHGVFGIPRPDIIIYLDVPIKTAQTLIEKKSARAYTGGNQKDKVEGNIEYQLNSREQSLRLVSQMNNWVRIVCEENGELLPVDVIHERIWAVVKKMV
jgi:dTMP kinase